MLRPWVEDHSRTDDGGGHEQRRRNLLGVVGGSCIPKRMVKLMTRQEFPWKMKDGWNGVDGGGRGSRDGN